jgi:hypothetical protein
VVYNHPLHNGKPYISSPLLTVDIKQFNTVLLLYYYSTLKMAFTKLILAFLFVLLAITLANAQLFADSTISGTLLTQGFAPSYSANAVYNPYAAYGYFGRK